MQTRAGWRHACTRAPAAAAAAAAPPAGYSNPLATLDHAAACGYRVAGFEVTLLRFGNYSSEPRVAAWIASMAARRQAFYSAASRTYVLAGVLFERRAGAAAAGGAGHDLRDELAKLLTAL